MKNNKDQISYRFEKYELAKLRVEYEEKGFRFIENKRRKIDKEKFLVIDGYAINPSTKEEIIFEVKALNNLGSQRKEEVLKQLKLYKKHFPNAKILLITPREFQPNNIQIEWLASFLLKFIESYKKNKIKEKLQTERIEIINVLKLSFSKLILGFKEDLDFEGHAHLTVEIGVKPNIINYEIPFNYSGRINNWHVRFADNIEDEGLTVVFDFFEFD
jgi:hypothetical protein